MKMAGITKDFIEKHGFERINNSMWRNENITLQSSYTHEGSSVHDRIFNTKKAFKACIYGKFVMMVANDNDFYILMGMYGANDEYNLKPLTHNYEPTGSKRQKIDD